MGRIRGVIFDIDGTLVNSNDAHARAWVEALREFDVETSFGEVRRLIGMGGDKLLPAVGGIEKESQLGRQITDRRMEIFFERYLPRLEPTRGAAELVRYVVDAGMLVLVATSASRREVDALLDVAGIRELVTEAASSTDASRSKPDPDIVRAALSRGGLHADRALMIGDTPYDVEAAGRASVDTVALRCGGWSDADLAGALGIYDDPADLLAHADETALRGGR